MGVPKWTPKMAPTKVICEGVEAWVSLKLRMIIKMQDVIVPNKNNKRGNFLFNPK
jgi:hypothetical protein